MDEPQLKYCKITIIDRNTSLQQVDQHESASKQIFWSDYFLSIDEVNKVTMQDASCQVSFLHHSSPSSLCWHPTWRVMVLVKQEKMGMQTIVSATGVLPSPTTSKACSWNLMKLASSLPFVNMDLFQPVWIWFRVVNCELLFLFSFCSHLHHRSKYPLVILQFLLELFGNHQALVYDIGCAFKVTASRNPILKPLLDLKQMQFFIPAWHSWSHNCKCQLQHHPLHIEGLGLEDCKVCEHLFSYTNHGAWVLHFTMKFHWMQGIDLILQYWDSTKYANLSM